MTSADFHGGSGGKKRKREFRSFPTFRGSEFRVSKGCTIFPAFKFSRGKKISNKDALFSSCHFISASFANVPNPTWERLGRKREREKRKSKMRKKRDIQTGNQERKKEREKRKERKERERQKGMRERKRKEKSRQTDKEASSSLLNLLLFLFLSLSLLSVCLMQSVASQKRSVVLLLLF